ncbi:MAG: S-layer homology domain-containing protein, partial [Clostridiales Family XIII bacterium]|nr:S-layer homology domain-containing protein [Clostridiales Family XIII bacterium]
IGLSKLSLYALVEGEKVINELDTPLDASTFTDVAGHWALEAIAFVVENGLFNGTSETTFGPNAPMDRGMFVTVLGRLAKIDATAYTATPFTDVKAGAYYAPYAAWASENKIVEGVGGGLFAPANQITRQEMAAMLIRYADFAKIALTGAEQASFADDAEIAAWAKGGVYALASAGILNGVGDGNFAPKKTAIRAEVATMLMRFARLSPVTQ